MEKPRSRHARREQGVRPRRKHPPGNSSCRSPESQSATAQAVDHEELMKDPRSARVRSALRGASARRSAGVRTRRRDSFEAGAVQDASRSLMAVRQPSGGRHRHRRAFHLRRKASRSHSQADGSCCCGDAGRSRAGLRRSRFVPTSRSSPDASTIACRPRQRATAGSRTRETVREPRLVTSLSGAWQPSASCRCAADAAVEPTAPPRAAAR